MSIALAALRISDLPPTVAACSPWLAVTGSAALNPSARSDTQRRERPGPSGELVPAEGQPRAARRRSARTASNVTHSLSRAAVTAVTSRGGASPQGAATPREAERASSHGLIQLCRERSRRLRGGLTADPAHNRKPIAGRAQLALQTHLPSSPALRPATDVRALTADASSLHHLHSHSEPYAPPVGNDVPAGPIEQFISRKAGRVRPAGTTTEGVE